MEIRRARLVEKGWDRALGIEAGEAPAPTGDEVLVALEASGVCHRDLLDRDGRFPFLRLPVTPGHEGAGYVIAVGERVTDWRVGDRVGTMHRDSCGACPACVAGATSLCVGAAFVLGLLADGTYATHLVAPQSALYALPSSDELGAAEAAVLHCTFGTAYRDLVTLGAMKAGERVLITGANGGVGAAAVQIAARLGAEAIAVVRDARHEAFVREMGAARVVVSPENRFHEQIGDRVDLALDTVGEPTFGAALRALRVGGRVVIVGNVTPARVQLNLGYLITFGLSIVGGSGATRAEMAALIAMHRERPWRVPIAKRLPLDEAEAAQRAVRAGGLQGRVALVPA